MQRERELILALGARDTYTVLRLFQHSILNFRACPGSISSLLPYVCAVEHLIKLCVVEIFGLSPESGRAPSSM